MWDQVSIFAVAELILTEFLETLHRAFRKTASWL